MRALRIRVSLTCVAFFLAIGSAATLSAQTRTVRIVTYNVEDDIGTFSGTAGVPRPGLIQPATSGGGYTGSVSDGGVLEGIGEEPLGANNNVQPLDILLLQETTSNAITVDPIVSALNTYYGTPGKYARTPTQANQSGSAGFGNGPNSVVYNTQAVQLLASVGIVNPTGSGNGVYRQVMRYEFAPAGETPTAANEFYIYVSHYKAGDAADDFTDRNKEAQIIRNNANSLGAGARILYVGDYNINGSSDASYQTIVGAGTNQGVDPYNPTGATGIDWTANSNNYQKTESATSLSARDDLQVMTSDVYNGTAGGLALVSNTYHTFGNNGTTSFHGGTNVGGNTSLDGVVADGGTLISASQLKLDLRWASDHLPVVADYTIPVPEPSTMILVAIGAGLLVFRGVKLPKRAD